MPEPTDMVLITLQTIQAQLKDLPVLREQVADVQKELKSMRNYLTYVVGLNSENKYELGEQAHEIEMIKARLDALEAR